MNMMERILARSAHYTISHEYEMVLLDCPDRPQVVIGDFYGDPATAIIDFHEKWAMVVGCGIILYRLESPFTPYEYNKKTAQWWEAHRSPADECWIVSVYQKSDNIVQFVVDPASAMVGVYELDLNSLSIIKVNPKERRD